jgi:hypothetical protein
MEVEWNLYVIAELVLGAPGLGLALLECGDSSPLLKAAINRRTP